MRPVEAEVFHADGRRTCMTKLIGASLNVANAPADDL
jgi:hypothetical protein